MTHWHTREVHWVYYSVCTVYTASVRPVYTLTTLEFGLGSLHFHGETGCFFVRGMVHGFHKKGVFLQKKGIKSEEKFMERGVIFAPAD